MVGFRKRGEPELVVTTGSPVSPSRWTKEGQTMSKSAAMDPCSAEKSLKWPQYLGSTLAALPTFFMGTVEGWTSPAIAHLQQASNSTAALSDDDISLVASMMSLGALAAALPAGCLANLIGRRTLLLALAGPYLLGWALIIYAERSVSLLCVGRFVAGLSVGAAQIVVPIYNEEISDVSVRGALGCIFDFMISAGILWCYLLSMFLDYCWMTISCFVLPTIFLLTFVWMPESPVYLLMKGRDDEADKSLRFFRGARFLDDYDTSPEMQNIKDYLSKECASSHADTWRTRLGHLRECFFQLGPVSNTAKAMRIAFTFALLVEFVGINPITYYSIDIFVKGMSSVAPDVGNTTAAVFQIVAAVVSLLLVDRLGRKLLLFWSGFGMAFSTALLAFHFLLVNHARYVEHFGWVPCFAVTLYIGSYALGFGPVPWLMIVEIIPTGAKEWVGSGYVLLTILAQFITSEPYAAMLRVFGEVANFGLFCGVCVLGTLFVMFFVPETKRKSRQVIQAELEGNWN